MKRPIVVITVGYIIGIVWGLYCKCSIVFFYILVIPIVILLKKNSTNKKQFKLFSIKRYFRYIKIFLNQNVIITIIISSIISNSITVYQNKKYENLYINMDNVTIKGVIVSNETKKDNNSVYKIKVENINDNTSFKNSYLYIKIANSNNAKIDYGDQIEIKGTYVEPAGKRNYKGFDYKEFLKNKKIYGTVNVTNIKVKNREKLNPILILSNRTFLKIKNNIEKFLPKQIAGLTLALTLGYADNLEEEIQQNFRDSNITHILAVSGLHITYIISGLMTVIKYTAISKRKGKIITSVILIAYMFISGFSPSIFRAGVMGILVLMSGIVYRKNDIWNSGAISLLIILIYNPFLLSSISLLLSYCGAIGIIVFNKTIFNLLENIKVKNQKYKFKIKKASRLIHFVKAELSIAISVNITIIPIYINYFNSISLNFIITNLLLSIIIKPIIITCFIAVLFSLVYAKMLIVISIILAPLLKILVLISELGAKLPLNKIYIGSMNIFEILIYYVCVFCFSYIYKIYQNKNPTITEFRVRNLISLIRYKIKQNRNKFVSIMLIIIAVFSLFFIIPKNLKIYFIDVGQGDCTLIKTPRNKKILIDGGGSLNSSYDVGKNILLPYLLDRRITKIDYIFISHFDEDHIGGLFTVMSELKVDRVVISKQGEAEENYKKFIQIVKEKNIKVLVVGKGDRVNLENNLYIDILWPNKDSLIQENILNNNSIVCKLKYKDFSMLFTGDIEEIAENQILQEYENNLQILNSTVLKVAHHGSKTSTTLDFLKAVYPKIALIGVGKNNKFGHPNDEVVKRLESMRNKNL